MRDIVLPETKPALEWVNGRVVQKAFQPYREARAQARFGAALLNWADANGCGMAGIEWEFRLAPPGEVRRPLVPDVAYLSYARLSYDKLTKTDYPQIAPDAVVEVLSPSDKGKDIDEKIRVYLTCGTSVVFLVDTKHQTVTIRDAQDAEVIARDAVITHPSLPGFAMKANDLFEEP